MAFEKRTDLLVILFAVRRGTLDRGDGGGRRLRSSPLLFGRRGQAVSQGSQSEEGGDGPGPCRSEEVGCIPWGAEDLHAEFSAGDALADWRWQVVRCFPLS